MKDHAALLALHELIVAAREAMVEVRQHESERWAHDLARRLYCAVTRAVDARETIAALSTGQPEGEQAGLVERLREDEARLRDLSAMCHGLGGRCRCEGCVPRLRRADNLRDAIAALTSPVTGEPTGDQHGTD